MNPAFIVLLVIIPAAAGLICVPLVNQLRACRVVGVVGFALNLGLALGLLRLCANNEADGTGTALVTQLGSWMAPYGIALVFDALSGLMVAAAALVALACVVHAAGSLSDRAERRYFHPLVNFMMAGVNLSFLTGDLFNLFVAFEIMLMASYGLLVLGRGKAQLSQAYKYVLLNLVASAVFVIAAGMAYGLMGTLNLADMARISTELAAQDALPAGFTAVGVLLLFVFTLKAGVFPLWFWLPDTYPTCPIAITALFGGVLTKVGGYAVARIFPLVFFVGDAAPVLQQIVLVGAVLTMAVGVFGALAFRTLRRSLAMFIIIGVGYALFGVAVAEPGAIAGSVFYMAQSMIVMAAAFLACGLIENHLASDDLRDGGALQKTHPWLGVLFLVGLLSIAGLPPTSGFYGKFAIIRDALGAGFTWTGLIAIGVGALSILAVLRIWCDTFWGPDPTPLPRDAEARATALGRAPSGSGYAAVVLLIVASLGIGFLPQSLFSLSQNAGRQVTTPGAYVTAVLGPDAASTPTPKTKPAPHVKPYDTRHPGSGDKPATAPTSPSDEHAEPNLNADSEPALEPAPEPAPEPDAKPAPDPAPAQEPVVPPVRPAAEEFHVRALPGPLAAAASAPFSARVTERLP